MSAAARLAMARGYIPGDPKALDRAKAQAGPAAGGSKAPATAETPSPQPATKLAWNGLSDPDSSPSDSTGAIGTRRYIELVNTRVGIYDRQAHRLTSAGLQSFWNTGGSADVFDPQIIWDPTTNRFYYAGDAVFSANDNEVAVGWSKTASPSNATSDWCHYFVTYGTDFPDYPKLGDTKDFVLIGTNLYKDTSANGTDFLGAEVAGIGKPPPGPDCPNASSLPFGVGQDLQVGTTQAFTPVPANQTDGDSTGWVVAIPFEFSGPQTSLDLFQVTRNEDGSPNIQTSGTSITVPSFSVPANAPQKGTRFVLDTLDGRLTQAVSAVDPRHGGKVSLWTQHTVRGGAGAMVRWYELDPVAGGVLQTGVVRSSTRYFFNGAISPDRVARGTTTAFGGNMVLSFNTSSASTFPAIRMVSKRGSNGVSHAVLVKSSPGFDRDFACERPTHFCRWGDYAAATPDPAAAATSTTGRVWLTGMWTKDASTLGPSGTSWRTWNWVAKP
jgi:hypothetical protein